MHDAKGHCRMDYLLIRRSASPATVADTLAPVQTNFSKPKDEFAYLVIARLYMKARAAQDTIKEHT